MIELIDFNVETPKEVEGNIITYYGMLVHWLELEPHMPKCYKKELSKWAFVHAQKSLYTGIMFQYVDKRTWNKVKRRFKGDDFQAYAEQCDGGDRYIRLEDWAQAKRIYEQGVGICDTWWDVVGNAPLILKQEGRVVYAAAHENRWEFEHECI